ncbi:MAG: exopolysaccharide biosynthesis protein [Sphingomonadales bacterium 32-68-7]|nr:MAG: exopolysaccharide biosynthesis protein [Sphingomonadales bacterium 32-68-7]
MNLFASDIGNRSVAMDRLPPPSQVSVSDSGSFLQRYIRIAQKWRWVLIGSITAAILLGLAATLLMTPQFSASATIEISRESDQVTSFQGVERDVSVSDQEFYQTQYGLLRARSLAERVASELRLVDDPAFFEAFDATDSDNPAFALSGNRYVAQGREVRQRIAGEVLLERVDIVPTRLSRLVDITFTGPDPQLSARIADAWAQNFITTNLERKVQSTSYGRQVLQGQLAEYKSRLDESQRQLVAYASNEQIINLPTQSNGDGTSTQERSIVADDLTALNDALNRAIADRIQAEARYRSVGQSGSSIEALGNNAINTMRERRAALAAEYAQLMVRFEPGYPAAQALQSQIDQLDRSISQEEARVSSSVQAAYRQAVQREEALRQRVNALKVDFLDLRRRSIQYDIYQQEVDTNAALYDGLLQRFKEIGVAAGVGVNNVSIVDTAEVPERPSSPILLLNLVVAALAGLGLGVALAFGLEQLDETISDPSEVQRSLGLPLLGSAPKVGDGETPREALLDRKSDLVEAYIAIHSTRPGEGKSTTALALAASLGRAGKRVILVDGDLRSPSVHHLGGVSHDRGLSNYLTGEDDIGSLTFEMQDLGITAMSAGPIPPNAAELLTGVRLSQLIERLLETYDHVVVDSPPVLGLADAPLIASHVSGIVYVVESHGIRASQIKVALSRLAATNAHIFGAVLAKFEARKAHYGYGYEYGYGYGRDSQTQPA